MVLSNHRLAVLYWVPPPCRKFKPIKVCGSFPSEDWYFSSRHTTIRLSLIVSKKCLLSGTKRSQCISEHLAQISLYLRINDHKSGPTIVVHRPLNVQRMLNEHWKIVSPVPIVSNGCKWSELKVFLPVRRTLVIDKAKTKMELFEDDRDAHLHYFDRKQQHDDDPSSDRDAIDRSSLQEYDRWRIIFDTDPYRVDHFRNDRWESDFHRSEFDIAKPHG